MGGKSQFLRVLPPADPRDDAKVFESPAPVWDVRRVRRAR